MIGWQVLLKNKRYITSCMIFSAVVIVSSLSSPSATFAQDTPQEANEPLTKEDIADGVAAVQALKQNAAMLKAYCDLVDMVDDAQPAEGASMDPKAESALDAKVDKALATLGENFADAYYAMDELPENDQMGKPLVAAFDELDKACGPDDDSTEAE